MGELSELERITAQDVIDKKSPGTYELSQIYGKKWIEIGDPNGFGGRFKEAVEKGLLTGISHAGKKSNNHQIYRIE